MIDIDKECCLRENFLENMGFSRKISVRVGVILFTSLYFMHLGFASDFDINMLTSGSKKSAQVEIHKNRTDPPTKILLLDRNQEYRSILRNFQGLKEVWKQQSGNVRALNRYIEKLMEGTSRLAKSSKKLKSKTELPHPAISETNTGIMPAPSGPVMPSTKPPSDENLKKSEEAIQKFLSPGLLGHHPWDSKTLDGVPDLWIQRSCDLAQRKLNNITILFASTPVDAKAMNKLLSQLRSIIYGLDSPEPNTSSSNQKSKIKTTI